MCMLRDRVKSGLYVTSTDPKPDIFYVGAKNKWHYKTALQMFNVFLIAICFLQIFETLCEAKPMDINP